MSRAQPGGPRPTTTPAPQNDLGVWHSATSLHRTDFYESCLAPLVTPSCNQAGCYLCRAPTCALWQNDGHWLSRICAAECQQLPLWKFLQQSMKWT